MDVNAVGQSMSMSMMNMLQSQSKSTSGSSESEDASSLANMLMQNLDTDGDGVLSSEEIDNAGGIAEKLQGADADDDGSVTLDELITDISKNGQRPPMGPPPSEDAETTATTIFDELDTNQDGVLSLAEIEAGGEKAQNILGADSNEDGEITFDELVEDITEMHEEMANSDTANKINGLTTLALNTYESATNILTSDDSNLSLAA